MSGNHAARLGDALPLGEVLRFGVSTLGSAAITVGLPIVLHEGLGLLPAYAVLIAFVTAFAVNFAMMRFFVFSGGTGVARDLARYAATNMTFRALEYLCVLALTVWGHVYYVVAVLIVLFVSTLAKFGVYRSVVFRAGEVAPDRAPLRPVDIVMSAALFAACVAAMMLPALANGHPILFPDSVGYYDGGEALYRAVERLGAGRTTGFLAPGVISGARSVYYGFPIALLYESFGAWAIPLAQSMLATVVIVAGFRRLGTPAMPSLVLTLVVASITGVGFFTSAFMPDLFAGFMILAMAILIGQWADLSRGERLFWLAIATYGMLVHKGHIAVLAASLLVMAICVLVRHRRTVAPFAALCAALLVTVAGHKAVDTGTRWATGRPPVSYPFLLARVVGDGTARPYLDAECARTPYFLCRYRARLTMSENEFLWTADPRIGLYRALSPDDKARVDREANAIVRGTILADPIGQIARTALRMAHMNVGIGVTRYGISPLGLTDTTSDLRPLLVAYQGSPITDGRIPLVAISRWMRVVYALAALALFLLAWRRPAFALGTDDMAVTRQVIVVGLVVNACVFGAISSYADRYQGRVAWLLPLVALAALWPLASRRLSGEVGPMARTLGA